MTQIVVALLFLAHGIGHVLFLANSWGIWKTGAARAALFESVLHAPQTTEGVFGILWLVPTVGFLMSAWGYYNELAWWRNSALVSALVSITMIIVWWRGLNLSSAFFALIFNVIIVGVLLWQQSTTTPLAL